MDELLKDFLLESYENLDRLDQDFVALETDPTALDKIGSIFRTIHTIKGTCGCLGLSRLEKLAHVGENLLSRVRDGQLTMDTAITTALLRLADAIREMLAVIEATGQEGDKDYSEISRELIRLNEGEKSPAAKPAPVATPAPTAAEPASTVTDEDLEKALAAELAMRHSPSIEAPASGKSSSNQAIASGATAASAVGGAVPPASAVRAAEPHDTHEADRPSAAPASSSGAATAAPDREKHGESLSGNAIRVDVGLLDKLMNLVGELVLARNQVLQFTAASKDTGCQGATQRLNLITTELQESVMKTRMQPIDSLWSKFPRIVRDVSISCGKKIRIEMEGRDTELDKTILEAIKDPLTHILRNSIDHGVEKPEVRLAKGKAEEGVLHMRAYHEGGRVNIEITDDGAGIDPERVKRKALEKGLITADHAARMSEREAIELIFLPGFSTAEKITNVSGRGVGMDVVKTNVEKIGGTVDVQSRLGLGTTLRIKIPLTLAIIPALVVTSGGERFAIPQVSLLELVRIEGGESKIERIHGTPVYRLRGNLLPLIYLNRVLGLKTPGGVDETAGESANIVVLRGGERQFGLVVDQINDTEEIVVKPLGKQLKGVNVFAGATIMGDGRVALILDVMGLAQKANVVSQSAEEIVRDEADKSDDAANQKQTLLLCKLQGGRRLAIPLSRVARLEEFPIDSLESAGGRPVVQYRGQIMPLLDVAEMIFRGIAPSTDAEASESADSDAAEVDSNGKQLVQVVVHTHANRNIGLRVSQILDVVEERILLQHLAVRPGVMGAAVIKDKVTEVIDLKAFVAEGGVESESGVESGLAA